MPSRKSNKGSNAIPSLLFDAPQRSDFFKMSNEQLDSFNSRIISIVSGNTFSGEKQNVIRLLELLSSNADAANILADGSIVLVLVKMLRHSKLLHVRILRSLDLANVLKFYSWYESSAHLWLVLEYCVGGNLMSLLQQVTSPIISLVSSLLPNGGEE